MTPQQAIFKKNLKQEPNLSLLPNPKPVCCCGCPSRYWELNHPELESASCSLIETLPLPFPQTTSQSLLRPPDPRYFRHREPKIGSDPLGARHFFSPSTSKASIFSPTDLEKWGAWCCLESTQALWKVRFLFVISPSIYGTAGCWIGPCFCFLLSSRNFKKGCLFFV